MPDPQADEESVYRAQIASATANLRDTAKWISGGVAVATGGVLAGSALSNLGAVEPASRLGMAIMGAALGLVALGFVLWRAVDVLAARRLTLDSLADGNIVPCSVRRQIETDLAKMFPRSVTLDPGYVPTFPALKAAMERVLAAYHGPAGPDKDAARADVKTINAKLEFLLPAATFEELRHRFLALKEAVFGGGVIVVLGFGLYAWAATPPKDEPLLKVPVLRTMRVDPSDAPLIKSKWPDSKCLTADLTLIELRIRQSGVSDVVTVPSVGCPPLLLELHAGRLSSP